ncbi:MAG: spermidine synthase, partial [Chitinophagaceae bacterium]
QKVQRPLLWYAGIEALLGVAALLFDGVFRLMQGWLFDSVIPGLDAGWTIDVVKWGAAVALTLPQAIMLGATFPLMSAGLLRLHPDAPGSSLSWLYFTNSLGASIGVLASGFYLVGKVGLPGTILTAGLVNFALAGAVYLSERVTGFAPTPALQPQSGPSSVIPAAVRAMLLTAFLTGAASFLYEIGWIRMLSLVLGSATHSFELMLSAFILGLALGSFYIRKKIDASGDPLRLLGWIQVVMALLALLSLPLYMQTFDIMAAALKALARSEQGYLGFTLFSHLICLVLMLPVTFCAGMTLPLITAVLLRGGHGEGSIGRVYAANTLGAIVGVLLAVHVVMPLLGLRMVVVVGALVDLGLGLWLLARAGGTMARPAQLALTAALVLAAGLSLLTRLDPQVTSSGVFRHGASPGGQVIFHRDGKTATVDVKRDKSGATSISTNGKVDAALSPVEVTSDDYTMALAALLPLSMRPEAKDVGVIGMGSGRTTHAFLLNPKLDRVDTVEIEPAMIEGAQLFGADVALGFSDPRSHLLIEDAKTHFARHRRQYDIIIS